MTQTRSESESHYEALRAESESRHTEIMRLLLQRSQNTKPLPTPPSTAAAPTITSGVSIPLFLEANNANRVPFRQFPTHDQPPFGPAAMTKTRSETKNLGLEQNLARYKEETDRRLERLEGAFDSLRAESEKRHAELMQLLLQRGYPLHAFPEGHSAMKLMGEEVATTEVGEAVADGTVTPTKPDNVVSEKKDGVEAMRMGIPDAEEGEESNEDKDGNGGPQKCESESREDSKKRKRGSKKESAPKTKENLQVVRSPRMKLSQLQRPSRRRRRRKITWLKRSLQLPRNLVPKRKLGKQVIEFTPSWDLIAR